MNVNLDRKKLVLRKFHLDCNWFNQWLYVFNNSYLNRCEKLQFQFVPASGQQSLLKISLGRNLISWAHWKFQFETVKSSIILLLFCRETRWIFKNCVHNLFIGLAVLLECVYLEFALSLEMPQTIAKRDI